MVVEELQEIQESDFDLSLVGFDPGEIDGLLALEDDEEANAAPTNGVSVSPFFETELCRGEGHLGGEKIACSAKLAGELKLAAARFSP